MLKQLVRGTIVAASLISSVSMAMSNEDKIQSAFSNLDRSRQEASEYLTQVQGLDFWASPNVFSPKYNKSTEMLNDNFPFVKGERFLEIGPGVGVTSVLAALHFDNQVVAVDINPEAVRLTAKNAQHHHVSDKVDARKGNVFSAIDEHEQFDTIYWDMPYVFTDSVPVESMTMLQRSVSDPHYRSIERFVANAKNHLKPQGRIIVGFGSNGDLNRFSALVAKHQLELKKIYEGYNPYREGITYQLFQLT